MNTLNTQIPAQNRPPNRGRQLRRWLGAGFYPLLSRWLDPSRQYSQILYAQMLSKLVPDRAAWLDAGCGHQVFKIKSTLEEAQLVSRTSLAVGCDLDLHALRIHRSFQLRTCSDLRQLPFGSSRFDIVTLNYVAEHLEDPNATFVELARVLRPGGALVIVTPHALGYFVRLSRLGHYFLPKSFIRRFILIREYRSPEDIYPTFYRANTREDLSFQLRTVGLAEEDFQMLRDPAIFNFIAPLAAFELLLTRFLELLGFRKLLGGTIIGVYRRTTVHMGHAEYRERVTEGGRLIAAE